MAIRGGRGDHQSCHRFFDFDQKAASTLYAPWKINDVSNAGTPVLDFVSGDPNGVFELRHDAEAEAQRLTLYWDDDLIIPATARPIFEARVKLNLAGATLTADQRAVWGMASALNLALDNIQTNVWFRVEGASNAIVLEGDDGTTDTDDQATSPATSIVDDAFHIYRIDFTNLSAIAFTIDGQAVGTVSCPLLTAADLLQPYFEIQKDGGADTDSLEVDYCEVTWIRA